MVNLRIYQKESDGRVGSNKMIFGEKALGLDEVSTRVRQERGEGGMTKCKQMHFV